MERWRRCTCCGTARSTTPSGCSTAGCPATGSRDLGDAPGPGWRPTAWPSADRPPRLLAAGAGPADRGPAGRCDRARRRRRRAADRGRPTCSRAARWPAGRACSPTRRNWKYFVNPLRPSLGRAVRRDRRPGARRRARRPGHASVEGTGREAVCVTHQLPIVAARRRAEGLRLSHDPRQRECALASVTSFTFDGDVVVRVDYAEPAAAAAQPATAPGLITATD